MKNYILVTGGLGIIGSHFIDKFLKNHLDYSIINIDKQTYAANLDYKVSQEYSDRYSLVKGDICNTELLSYLFSKYDFCGLVNIAAESHVDNSICTPEAFVKTNIYGTYALLGVAKNYNKSIRFIHISTDEVFGSLGKIGLFSENSRYFPNSLYSASKAVSDHLARSYNHTFDLDVIVTNCSNNFGPRQHSEKFIPKVIHNALQGKPIPIYGDGLNIRDWIFVEDHFSALELVYFQGKKGESYNIGGSCEWENIQISEKICKRLDEIKPKKDRSSYSDQISFVKDRPGHDRRYAIDSKK